MNMDIDRSFIWIAFLALAVFALANKEAFGFISPISPVNPNVPIEPQLENCECEQEQGPGYIYKNKRKTKERRCL